MCEQVDNRVSCVGRFRLRSGELKFGREISETWVGEKEA